MIDVLTVMEYLPVGLALVGAVLIGSGLLALRPRNRPRTWAAWARTYLHAFRGVVVGMCLIGAAWGWSAHIGWLLAASVCIAIGEFLESSYYDVVLAWGTRTRRIPTGDSF
jgi:hypothetical protein